ncbi:MAG TPA: branched-chain amino acid ABC transporter permease [Solirubrobacteraceae bacterium]|nr:branched-chain amino acid ABC transporter permease [Solirubrobacteraceae bacterium]
MSTQSTTTSRLQRVRAVADARPARAGTLVCGIVVVAVLPLLLDPLSGFVDTSVKALALVVMALGLNIVVGFAGLLDLGYVAFYAIGAYSVGWFASDHFAAVNHGHGVHVLASVLKSDPAGIHFNFLLVAVIAIALTALAGTVIGLPTLRLRGDYIAIVTLAFGEIIGRIAVNGSSLHIGAYHLTNGQQAISPLDPIKLPFVGSFDSSTNLRPYYWTALALVLATLFINFRLRDSRLGRAWIALREDEVAAASMGIPLVRTKLLAYATGAGLGGLAGAFLGYYINSVNAGSFEFSFSIFVLAMVILGGLGSIWGVVIGALALAYINYYLIPDVLNTLPSKIGLHFDLTQLSFGIFGFLLVIMMVLRPEGLLPERRRKLELKEGVGAGEDLYNVRS